MQTLRPATQETGRRSDHRVILIPGFLGFNALGDHGYFAQTVGQTLANRLEKADLAGPIEVDAFETIPAGSLDERADKLREQLREVLWRHPNAKFHLVGHSTGGLDAELLLRTPRPKQRRTAEDEQVRDAVRSIVTIAAPLAGTSLASSPLARFFAIDSPGDLLEAPLALLLLRGPRAAIAGLRAIAGLLLCDSAVASLVRGVLQSRGIGSSYALSLILTRALIDDLRPEIVERVLDEETREDPKLARVPRFRFVTIARRALKPTAASALFQLLYSATADATPKDARVDELGRQLAARADKLRVIGAHPLPRLDAAASDGVVNTFRQLLVASDVSLASELDRVVALVVADHIDVVGYFEGKDGQANGFLSSGSDFRDGQFNELHQAIAQTIETTIRATAPEDYGPRPTH